MAWLNELMQWLFGSPSLPEDVDVAPQTDADAPTTRTEPISTADAAAKAPVAPASDSESAAKDIPKGWWVSEARTAAPPTDKEMTDQTLYDRLVRVVDDAEFKLPRLSRVAQQALCLLNDEKVDHARLASAVQQDAAIAAEVLRLANSPLYRGIVVIKRLDVAIGRLGRRVLQSIVLAETVKGLAILTGGPQRSLGEELWQRSLASAVVLEQFAPRFKLAPDEQFLVGLLHDIGMLAILRVMLDYEAENGRQTPRPVFDRLCDEWHEHIGLGLAEAWNLPDPLPALIASHHATPEIDDPLQTRRLLVQAADAACAMLGYAPAGPESFFGLHCVQRLGLHPNAEVCRLLEPLPELVRARVQGGELAAV